MKAKIKNLTDEILAALAPIFIKHKDYDDIFNAMCLVMGRIVQATPDKGNELLIMEDAYTATKHALVEFLKLEKAYEAEQAAKKAKLDEGIISFSEFAKPEQPVVEPGSAADYPDNPNQNLAKTVAPFAPGQALAALNGGMGAEAQAAAEEAQAEAAEQARQDTYKETP